MIRLSISVPAYEAIVRTLDKGVIPAKVEQLNTGHVWIWLPKGVARALATLRRPGESYSDVILKLAQE